MNAGLIRLVLILTFACSAFAGRIETPLLEDWKFIKRDLPPAASPANWEDVNLPHTWNTIDGADGLAAEPAEPEGYYRGPAWYFRTLPVPKEWKTRRVFIRFEGAATVADVLVNGIPVGQHRGAFAAFCFELTPYLQFDGRDTLKVRVDNARAFEVAPLAGDFTIFGGLYRPVTLLSTESVCVSPIFFASPGVYVNLQRITQDAALIEAKVKISSGEKTAAEVVVEVEIRDADGRPVAQERQAVKTAPVDTVEATVGLSIKTPRLWNGRGDPYLYRTVVRVICEGQEIDEVNQPLGIREVELSKEKGFLLNGRPYPLHGVNRHQDTATRGWAMTEADHRNDHALIREIGATAVRLAHYPQATAFHDESDRTGLIVWQEIPLVDSVAATPEFLENARLQLREMIWQNRHHPSIALWGLYNELERGGAEVKTAGPTPVVATLQALAKQLDSSRPTVAASQRQDAKARHRIPDAAAWNIYPGWYTGAPEDATAWIASYQRQMGAKIGISEYGAGANITQHQEGVPAKPVAGGAFHPEEWQTLYHEKLWAQLRANPDLWGTYVWVMFDFAADARNEGGTPGLNDKGLVTRDRQTRKDAFYFYKANWNPEPMLHLVSKRMTPRREALTEVKAYTNCTSAELRVNGLALGTREPDTLRIVRWENIRLNPGKNHIEIRSLSPEGGLTDGCDWMLDTN